MSGIYIHIPFCRQACSYCDFYFVTRQQLRDSYVEGLINEIKSYQDTAFAEEIFHTIYIGGGTPSLLPVNQLEDIFSALEETFATDAREITLEMNPDDVTADYLAGLKHLGVNRASMGVQSFQPELLSFMHRAHNREEALRCLQLLSELAFDAFTVDLIYGNPGQQMEQLAEDLDLLLKFDPPHVSAYSLTVESGTRLGKQVELGRINPPEDEAVARQFEMLNERLAAAGIQRYEVSNFSRPGREALHNSNYWQHENYLGLGPGAHSFWWDEQARRWSNEPDIKAYLEAPAQKETEHLTPQQLAEERIMMGLRTREGVGAEELSDVYQYNLTEQQERYLQEQEAKGMLLFNDKIKLSDRGILLADAITLDLLTLR